jgi:hypothetical protein
MKIDLRLARKDLALLVEQIRELKRRRAESGQPHWTGADIRELGILKDNATHMCMMLAHRRGRIHLKRFSSLDEQAKALGTFGQMYVLSVAA